MHAYLLASAAAALAAAPLGTPPIVENAGPSGLLSLFKAKDYPTAALRDGEQGTVVYKVHVTAAGKIDACTIVQSSGSATLDEATCKIVRERAHFAPARDSGGKAIDGTLDGRVRWQLPEGGAVTWSDFVVRHVFTIGADNKLGNCSVEPGVRAPISPLPPCEASRARAEYMLGEASTDFAFAGKVMVVDEGSLVGAGADTLTVGKEAGQELLARWSTEVQFDENGRPISCRPGLDDPVSPEMEKDLCDIRVEEKNVPASARKVAPRTMVFYSAVYLRAAQ